MYDSNQVDYDESDIPKDQPPNEGGWLLKIKLGTCAKSRTDAPPCWSTSCQTEDHHPSCTTTYQMAAQYGQSKTCLDHDGLPPGKPHP
ncbi:hypothetical protein, partial [Hydrogenophaga sp. A37]|uniref:hypothetical protein n=1 Tax=Hydrogenophaga sp. A37 TaxID=1945864 RepID=UPI001C0B27BB